MADQRTTLQARQDAQIQKARLILNSAERETRALSEDERTELKVLETDIDAIGQRIAKFESDDAMMVEINRLGGKGGNGARQSAAGPSVSLGDQFVKSPTFEWLKQHRGALPAGAWTSASSELQAATLTSDPASGGDLVVPDYRPGILAAPTRTLTLADLIAPGTTDSNAIRYMKETTFTNAAAAVAEGATKPESTLIFDQVTDPVVKLAHWLPVTEELLEDAAGIRAYIDIRLRLGVAITEDDQFLSGSGTGANMLGILNRTGLATAVARGTDSNADALLKQIAAILVGTGLQPTGIVMHPTNWLTVQMAKTEGGEYISGSGPFAPPAPRSLWGLPVAVTPAITAGTALVGAFKTAAQYFRKGGVRVEVSNSHADFFVKNLVAIRAEERIALIVPRPSAFGLVTGLD